MIISFYLMLNIGRGMNSVPSRISSTGGNYRDGAGFDATTWLEIISVYQSEMDKEGKCTICRLAELCNISPSSASKAISFAKEGAIVLKSRGRPKKGLGSSFGLTYEHHMLINQLYLENPARTLEDYSITFEYLTGIVLSTSFFSRWFNSFGA